MPDGPSTSRPAAVAWRCLLALTLLAATPAAAAADWHLSPFFGLSFDSETTLVDLEKGASIRHWNYGGTVALIGRGLFGVEGHFLLMPGFFENDEIPSLDLTGVSSGLSSLAPVTDSLVMTLMGNVVLTAPLGWNEYGLRPYVSGGLGLMRARQGGAFAYTRNMLGYDVGGGAEGPLSDHTGLRFDLRFFRSLNGPEQQGESIYPPSLRFWTASVGFTLRY